MGHLSTKDLFDKLSDKISRNSIVIKKSETLFKILKEIYSEEEAALIIKMPYGLSSLKKITRVTKINEERLKDLLDSLSDKGLILDLTKGKNTFYTISPFVIGIFEFTMMRTDGAVNFKEMSKLFHKYMFEEDGLLTGNFGKNEKISPMRNIPHIDSIMQEDYAEVLDYEKAHEIIKSHNKFSVGICSCRHKEHHLETQACKTPLKMCSTFGSSAEYMIKHKLAEEISKEGMLDILEQSKEMGLVLNADNIKNNASFICHCCKCCCSLLKGIREFGHPNILVTSNFIATVNNQTCSKCKLCIKHCPVNALFMNSNNQLLVNNKLCIGCGVCNLKCSNKSIKLKSREKRIITPEDTFERVILQCLERDTLHYQIFPEPDKASHKLLRGFVGGFLKLTPVKMALMSNTLRSKFLNQVRKKTL